MKAVGNMTDWLIIAIALIVAILVIMAVFNLFQTEIGGGDHAIRSVVG